MVSRDHKLSIRRQCWPVRRQMIWNIRVVFRLESLAHP